MLKTVQRITEINKLRSRVVQPLEIIPDDKLQDGKAKILKLKKIQTG